MFLITLCCCSLKAVQHDDNVYVFAIKSNGLYDLAAIPNLGAEFTIKNDYSLGFNWMYSWWKNHNKNRHWRIYGGDFNARWYLKNYNHDLFHSGHHIGLYAQVLLFQIAFGRNGYISGVPGEGLFGKPFVGGGVEYGYELRLSDKFNLDFSLGVGYLKGEYRSYRQIDGCYVKQESKRFNFIGPTKAEVSLVYYIRINSKRKGMVYGN